MEIVGINFSPVFLGRHTVKTRERCALNKLCYNLRLCVKVSRAVGRGVQLIVVDNTNTMAWEMKPYITLAVNNGYKVNNG